jgi:hypothetical protein
MLAIVLSVHQLTALVSCLVSCSYVGHCFDGPSIDSFGILLMDRQNTWRYQRVYQSCQLMDRQNNEDTKQDTNAAIALSVHQLTALVSCLVSSLFCRSINWQLWYPVWYLHCFVGPSMDSIGILLGIFIVLSVHQLTALVYSLVSWTDKTMANITTKYQTGYQCCQLMDRQNNGQHN